MITTNDIRTIFLKYFQTYEHVIIPSSSLVPYNDPTLLFTNAGMVQFKNAFTGLEKYSYSRAASIQKCIRVGGKHNDLDNVGYTSKHHTFFEMLGNFSFGDYFKETAIMLSWNLLVQELNISPHRLVVTVHSSDEEAAILWRKISGLSDSKILRISTSDNFWQMGDTGPCGPCSEIFYDYGSTVSGGLPGSQDADGDRFVEIWNLVFMQFEQQADGTRVMLPQSSIDTGMGLERIATILQGKFNNYATDLFRELIENSACITKTDPDGLYAASHRVIADHLRASAFLIADGILPDNEGRGYVLRRIIRRAVRHVYQMGIRVPLLWQLVPTLIEQMGAIYPELELTSTTIRETLYLEEEKFQRTLGRGLNLLEEEVKGLKPGSIVDGEVAFRLHDTYGFPLDLTEDILRSHELSVDVNGFKYSMDRQRERARHNWIGSGEEATEEVWLELKEKFGSSKFLGYDREEDDGILLALIVEGKSVNHATAGSYVMLLADQTPFYAESGGQLGDNGTISTTDGGYMVVHNTVKKAGILYIHVGVIQEGELVVHNKLHLKIDTVRRGGLQAHHSATHLLHAALQHTLGRHVLQRGSLVSSNYLRLDVSYPHRISANELRSIESLVNYYIRANSPVTTCLMDPQTAIESGVIALFGDKYTSKARVVAMGDGFSAELCGGTHVYRTGDIGLFLIVSESSIAAGIRRIEAISGITAEAYVYKQLTLLSKASEHLDTTTSNLLSRITALTERQHSLEREVSEIRHKLILSERDNEVVKKIKDVTVMTKKLFGMPVKDLKRLTEALKQQLGSPSTVILFNEKDGKIFLVIGITHDLARKISAIDLVRVGASKLGGTGGGRPILAQAGGNNIMAVPEAVEAIESLLESSLNN